MADDRQPDAFALFCERPFVLRKKGERGDLVETSIRRIINFASERGRDRFHTPENRAMDLSVEAAELAEIFQRPSEEGGCRLDTT